MRIHQFLVGEMANFTYLLVDEKTRETIIIDPSWDLDIIFDFLKENNLTIKYIINTHSHFDHIAGNNEVVEHTGAQIMQHKISPHKKDFDLDDGQVLKFGNSEIQIIYTPGHSKDSICLLIDNDKLITGDTLFVGSCGRLDLPGGNPEEMYESLYNKIINLNENLVVFPGHHYGNSKSSTIKNEKMTNFVFKFANKDDFLNFMSR